MISYYEYLSDDNITHIFDKEIRELNPSLLSTFTSKKPKVKSLDSFPALKPLRSFTLKLKEEYGPVLKDKIILFLQHFVSDLPAFVEYLKVFDIDYPNMIFLQKTYPYLGGNKVFDYLDDKCKVVQQQFDFTEQLKVKRDLLKEVIDKCEKENKKLLIIEDGGKGRISLCFSSSAKVILVCTKAPRIVLAFGE